MQSLKKKLLTILSLSLFIVLAGNYNVLAKMEENGENSNNACEVLTSEEPMLNKEYAGYVGVGIVVLILVAIPQLQYRKHPDTYFLITEDYDAYLEKVQAVSAE